MPSLSRRAHSAGAWSKVVKTIAFVQLLWFLYSREFLLALVVAPICTFDYLRRKGAGMWVRIGVGRGGRYDPSRGFQRNREGSEGNWTMPLLLLVEFTIALYILHGQNVLPGTASLPLDRLSSPSSSWSGSVLFPPPKEDVGTSTSRADTKNVVSMIEFKL